MKQPRKLYLQVEVPDTKETAHTGKRLSFYERGFLGSESHLHLLTLQRSIERFLGEPHAPERKP